MKKVAIHLAKGFEEVEALSVVDVLRRADIPVTTVSVTGEKQVTGSHHITILADALFEEVDYEDVDMIVLPGGKEGVDNLYSHEGLKAQISAFNDQKKYLAAICAGPSIYGRMGLLKGEKAISFPAFQQYLEGAEVVNVPAIKSRHFITGKGVGVALDFALELVKNLKDEQTARELRQRMVMEK